jgi:glycosyltransferase involved in cell wall biosynthesis
MNILQVNKFFHFRGGADKYFFELSELLQSHGHRVLYLSSKSSRNRPTEFARYFVSGYSEDTFQDLSAGAKALAFANGIYSLEARVRVRQLLRDHRVEIGHAHNIFYQVSPSIFATLKEHSVPAVMSLLDSAIVCAAASLYVKGSECYRCKDSLLNILRYRCYHESLPASLMGLLAKLTHQTLDVWRHVDLFFTASAHFRNLLVEWGLDGSRIIVNPYFNRLLDQPPCHDHDGYSLFVGRISMEKGIDTLLRAYQEIRYPLVIVGEGPARLWAEEYVREHKMDHVRFLGFVSGQQEMTELLRRCHFVVVPSSWYELFPLIATDALCLGKPVVASDSGGIPEIVEHETNGLIFPRLDAAALRQHVRRMIAEPGLAEHLGRRGRAKASGEYRADLHYNRVLAAYRSLLGNRAA